MNKLTLEIACFSVSGILNAQATGAHRLEFCENPAEGGTTPSYGALQLAKKKIHIPVFPIIRPRGGDFLYSDEEFAIMKHDVNLCKQLGYEGVVVGMLLTDGSIDITRISQLVKKAYPMEVTFHRAFDRCHDPVNSIEQLIECGCQRILTSGQAPTAMEGAALIKDLVTHANKRIIIIPGSGVKSSNLAPLAKITGAVEFHASARIPVKSKMNFEVPAMDESLTYMGVDMKEVKNLLAVINASAY